MILTLYPIQLHPCFSVHIRTCHKQVRASENHSTIWLEPEHEPSYPKVLTFGSHNPSLNPGILHSLNHSATFISLTCLGRGHNPQVLMPSKHTSPSCLLSPSLTEGEAGAREGGLGKEEERARGENSTTDSPKQCLSTSAQAQPADSNRPCLGLADTRFPLSCLPGLSSLFPDLIRK